MQEKEIMLSIRSVKIKELKFTDLADTDSTDKKAALKKTILMASNLTEEEYNNLSAKDGIILATEVNELNGFSAKGFQQL